MSTPDRAPLDRLLWPRSVAVVGASTDLESISGRPLRILRQLGFAGRAYPVNPRHESILGMPAFPSVRDLPEPVDLAVIAVPAAAVPGVIDECAAAGVGAAVVLSSGFAEGAGHGAELEARVRATAAASGLRVLGPNGEGFVNLLAPVAAGFSPVIDPERGLRRLVAGDVAVIAQSGGLGFAFLHDGLGRGLGFAYVVSTGNECDLDSLDLLEHVIEDERVRVVLLFVEGFREARRFPAMAARAAALGKPLIVAKAGRSAAGRRAAISHTAHLAGRDAAYKAVFRHWGVERVHDQEQAVDVAMALSMAPRPAGRRVAIVTVSGGAGVWAADAIEGSGLSVPLLGDRLQARLRSLLPSYGSAANPVDMTAQVWEAAGGVVPVLEMLASSGEVDLLVLVLSLTSHERLAKERDELARLLADSHLPLLVYAYTQPSPESVEILSGLRVPWYPSSLRVAGAALALVNHGRLLERGPATPPPMAAPGGREGERRVVVEHEVKALLRRRGLPVPEGALARTPRQAGLAARALGGAVAVKVQARRLPHKSLAGAVTLGLRGGEAVRRAAAAMRERISASMPEVVVEGFLVERMAPPGVEAIVGAIRDADFGQLVMVGAGGPYAELLGDAVFAPAPIDAPAALELIASTRLALLLAEADVEALARLVARLSELALDADLAEVDLNPVLVHPAGQGVTVVDAVAVTSREPITDEMVEALAAEAEAGYDPTTFRPRKGGRPSLVTPRRRARGS